MSNDAEIETVLREAIEAVKARNGGSLPADDLMVFLACEIVARNRTLAQAGKVIPGRIAANLDMDSRRREVALRAENAMLREALEFYCCPDHYRLNDYPNGTRPIWDDYGAKARAALG